MKELLQLQEKYHDILIKDAGLRTLCDTLTAEIGNPVFILDKFRENVLYLDRELRQDDSDFYSYLDHKDFEKKEVLDLDYDLELERVSYLWQEETVTELQVKLKSKDENFGYLVILENNRLEEDDYLAVIQAVYALNLKLHQNNLIQNLARKCSNELIEDLLQGKIDQDDEIIKRGQLAGWDLTVSYQMFVISFDTPKSKDNNGERTLYKYELEEKITHSLHRIIRTTLSTKYIIFSYNDNILLLIHYPQEVEQIKDDITNIHEQLKSKFSSINFSIGSGEFIEDCQQIPKSYQQGLYTLDFVTATKQDKEVFFYHDLGVLRLLWQLDNNQLRAFVDEFLADLIAYDQKNNSNWLETLGVYLKTGCSIQQAANLLPIHSNTMRYRIERIEEILGVDLQDFELRSNLAIAYKINKFIIGSQEGD
jgi:sugar diacid utilization regulator